MAVENIVVVVTIFDFSEVNEMVAFSGSGTTVRVLRDETHVIWNGFKSVV